MKPEHESVLREKMDDQSFQKLCALDNEYVNEFVGTMIKRCNPASVYMCDDSEEDAAYIRQRALETGEELPLAKENHTVHYDGYGDQARDKENTRFLVPSDWDLGGNLNSIEREQGLNEILGFMENAMTGKEAIIKCFCEAPVGGPFSLPCLQISDSFYVLHSEDMLYRRGYEQFRNMENKQEFFRFCHSAGELDERGNSKNLDKRRVYMDLLDDTVYSVNNQYAGNSVGLKKHAMRLAIKKSGQENWLCEHMFIMNVPNKEKNRKTYFCGAFPSACGKTSTAMIPGEKIVGDDIAYFRNVNGEFRAANVENGIFGIIRDVNSKDDPLIYKTLEGSGNETIFSNVLVNNGEPYWLGMGCEVPKEGMNHSGEDWYEGKTDADGNEINCAHKNSRYTIRLKYLENIDEEYDNPQGVPVHGIIYGGRDSDTSVPIEEAFDWTHGIITKGCTLESETTAATLGQEGVRRFNPMSNLDFISYPIGEYIQNNLKFVEGMQEVPRIYAFNYFLQNPDGEIATSKMAKKVWLHWAEGRQNGDYGVYETPTGLIPKYEDLQPLFQQVIDSDLSREEYEYLFSCRVNRWLEKIERITENYNEKVPDTPQILYDVLEEQKQRLNEASKIHGDMVKPGEYKR